MDALKQALGIYLKEQTSKVTQSLTNDEKIAKMVKITTEFIEAIEFPDPSEIPMQCNLYKQGIRAIYMGNPNEYQTLFGENGVNSYWAQRMYNKLQGAESFKKIYSFKKIKSRDDNISGPATTNTQFYEKYYNLPLFFTQFDKWIDGAAAQARDYQPFMTAGTRKPTHKIKVEQRSGSNHSNTGSNQHHGQTRGNRPNDPQRSTTLGSYGPSATNSAPNQNKSNQGEAKAVAIPTLREPNCNYCGHYHRPTNKKECVFKRRNHPHVNNEPVPFTQSTNGKIYAAKQKTSLEYNKTFDGQDMGWDSHNTVKKGKVINHYLNVVTNHTCNYSSTTYFTFRSQDSEAKLIETNLDDVLIDTGAITFSIISKKVVDRLVKTYPNVELNKSHINLGLNSPINKKASICNQMITFSLNFTNEVTREREGGPIHALVVDLRFYDLIVGTYDVRRFDLCRKCTEYIYAMGGEEPTIESILVDEPIIAPFMTTNTGQLTNQLTVEDTTSQRTQQRNTNNKRARTTNCFQKQSDTCSQDQAKTCSQDQANDLSRPQSDTSRTWLDKARPISCRTCYQNWIYTLLAVSDQEVGTAKMTRYHQGRTTLRDLFCNKCTPPIHRQVLRRCTACHTPPKERTTVNRPLGTTSGKLQPNLCACCRQINNHRINKQIRDNIHDAEADDCNYEPESLQSDLANRIGDDYPALRHNLNSINPTSSTTNINPTSLTTRIPIESPPPVGTKVHISQILSTDQSEDDTDMNNFQQWFDSPTDSESLYVPKDTLSQNSEWKQVMIHCTDEQDLAAITTILQEHPEVFSSKLPTEPARVPPLSFTLDQSEWVTRQNQEPPRRQSLQKEIVIRQMTDELTSTSVIATSHDAQAWSQVHLARKPNGKWRYCIDFRRLNQLLRNLGWPLPRIQDLIARIGNTSPKYFGKIDLTNGYHQMPLAADARKFTAFRTPQGLFEWQRVPMGIKQAAAYFQMQMATILHEVVGKGVELYIDDIIIYASHFSEFQNLLRHVLSKLRHFGIVANPKKTELAFPELQILGHVVDHNGVSFDRKKLQGVVDFPQPQTVHQMQQFLGLTTHFRDHIPAGQTRDGIADITEMERPLRDLVSTAKANRTNKLVWTDTANMSYPRLQQAVWNCPKLFFYDSVKPVFLHTDASNHGIGAYLFQMDDDKELPIGFMSKSLNERQSRWSTFEQEAYAIYMALQKFQYLLRDIQFTIRTDHRNLTYINNKATSSNKVLSWKLEIQQYDAYLEHLEGHRNIVADLHSRLCSLLSTNAEYPLQPIEDALEQGTNAAFLLAALTPNRVIRQPRQVWQPTPMPNDIHRLIDQCHNFVVGHGGVDRTLQKLYELVEQADRWKSMRQDVCTFIRQCPCCIFMQPSKRLISASAPYNMSVSHPNDRINIDTIGPFPSDEDGNTHIIAIVDVFSRFIELYPTKTPTATDAYRCLLQWYGRYGLPNEILSDNGSEYINYIIDELHAYLRINHLSIQPHSHEENTIIERAIKEVQRHLRNIVFDTKVKPQWSLYLPLVQRIMNATTHSALGCSPASILYGRTIDLNQNLYPKIEQRLKHNNNQPLSKYLTQAMNMQQHIIELATNNQECTDFRHLARKEVSPSQPYDFKEGDYVIYSQPNFFRNTDARQDKLSPHYKGPYQIVTVTSQQVHVRNLLNNKIIVCHPAHIHPFVVDPNRVNHNDIAQQAATEYVVEKVLKINGIINPRTKKFYKNNSLECLIRWAGYDESEDSWEPYKELRYNDQFIEYCRQHNLQYLIPTDIDN